MFLLCLLVITSVHWTQGHLTFPVNYCDLAKVCVHDNRMVCATTEDNCVRRSFLDQCDMYEYNCDFHAGYLQTDTENCLEKNKSHPSSSSDTSHSDSKTTHISSTNDTISSPTSSHLETNINSTTTTHPKTYDPPFVIMHSKYITTSPESSSNSPTITIPIHPLTIVTHRQASSPIASTKITSSDLDSTETSKITSNYLDLKFTKPTNIDSELATTNTDSIETPTIVSTEESKENIMVQLYDSHGQKYKLLHVDKIVQPLHETIRDECHDKHCERPVTWTTRAEKAPYKVYHGYRF